MGRPRLRRGCSLEVIFEEDISESKQDISQCLQTHCQSDTLHKSHSNRSAFLQRYSSFQSAVRYRPRAQSPDTWLVTDIQSIDEERHIDDKEESEWQKQNLVISRRHIVQHNCLEDFRFLLEIPDEKSCSSKEEDGQAITETRDQDQGPLLSNCECCEGHYRRLERDCQPGEKITNMETPKRRNSTYIALACANAVSQGSMTKKVREIFEKQAVLQASPATHRNDILETIQHRREARRCLSNPADALINNNIVIVEKNVVRCDKCSSILNPLADSGKDQELGFQNQDGLSKPQTNTDPTAGAAVVHQPLETEQITEAKKLINQPNNREVVQEELPKPDTVKNARSLFEAQLVNSCNIDVFATLRSPHRISHVKSNPSSKILRSEASTPTSTMTLGRMDQVLRGMVHQPAKLVVPVPMQTDDEMSVTSEDKAYVIAVGRMAALRWPSRREQVRRSPSPPAIRSRDYCSARLAGHYRSHPSLYRSRSSRRSTDAESLVSEVSDWSCEDLESEASYSSGRDSLYDKEVEARYVSPQVLEKIRSYGMTFTYVEGKMICLDDVQETEHVPKQPKLHRSAGQSVEESVQVDPSIREKKEVPKNSPRIVACLPKQTSTERIRHSSGESSASSGISSARSEADSGSDGSSTNSPFSSLKRSNPVTLPDSDEHRSASPGPAQLAGVKSLTSSPFGLYSVIYDFRHSIPVSSPVFI